MIFVSVDTNYFLHFEEPSQIDWREAFDSDEITIVVSMNTMRELDNQKTNGASRGIRKRALDAIKLCLQAIDAPIAIKAGVSLMLWTK